MKAHKIRQAQGSQSGEIIKIVCDTRQDQRAKGQLPALGGALLGALLARQQPPKGGKA